MASKGAEPGNLKAYGTITAITGGLVLAPWLMAHEWILIIMFIALLIALVAVQ